MLLVVEFGKVRQLPLIHQAKCCLNAVFQVCRTLYFVNVLDPQVALLKSSVILLLAVLLWKHPVCYIVRCLRLFTFVMTNPNANVENVLPVLLDWQQSGQRVCLATLYHSQGGSPRPIGSQMAIAEDGRWFGYLSGGCAEQAIADEGAAIIKQGHNRSVRYGLGSPYLDIQLPCGAGIDVWFDQSVSSPLVKSIMDHLKSRKTSALRFYTNDEEQGTTLVSNGSDDLPSESFQRWYVPLRRLYIIGAGPAAIALAKLATEADYQVHVLTPDAHTFEAINQYTDRVEILQDHSQVDALDTDQWTSLVTMFHEHERETKILTTFLETDVAYIGALGSKRTHSLRIEQLMTKGISADQCKRIHGPVGLDILAKTPMEIAISVLAEITLKNQQKAPALLDWNGSMPAS